MNYTTQNYEDGRFEKYNTKQDEQTSVQQKWLDSGYKMSL